ncbi:MAG: glycosyltransferase family 4 protein [Vulcanimicrobiaceae bacterium]
MRIAQVAPLTESCPPKLYGGTERVVAYLTEELVRAGHEVTLFASGDSQTSARLVPCCRRALRLDPVKESALAHHMIMLNRVRERAAEFDLVHVHLDYLHFPVFAARGIPVLTTQHGRLDVPGLAAVFDEFKDLPMVSISDAQRLPVPTASWLATVHHGLPRERFRLAGGEGGYLAFIGRISPEKRPDRAIAIARRVGMPLRIAAKIDDADRAYFERTVAPLLDDPLVEFIGEIGEAEKQAFIGEASALLFPIDWPEPFGLVMIEAMACGTPTIAFRCGSVEEIIEDGRSGWIVDSVAEAVAAVPRALALERATVRASFEARFTAEQMTRAYLALYRALIAAPRVAIPRELEVAR